MFTVKIVAELENEDGEIMARQTNEWFGMDRAKMLTLEGSYLSWMASLPVTIGADQGEAPASKRR